MGTSAMAREPNPKINIAYQTHAKDLFNEFRVNEFIVNEFMELPFLEAPFYWSFTKMARLKSGP
jgi:hypothetical protein